MKKLFKYTLGLFILTLVSCEEVIDLDLPSKEPRLVVEANLDYASDSDQPQDFEFKLTKSAPFYDAQIQPATNAKVYIEHHEFGIINFEEEGETGIYKGNNIPLLQPFDNLTLHIEYNGEIYEAKETYIPNNSTPLYILQNKKVLFGEEYYEVTLNFKDSIDNPNDNKSLNYYLVERKRNDAKSQIHIQNNDLTKGNTLKSIYLDEDSKVNDSIRFNHYKISKTYFHYLRMIIESIDNGGGPFQIPVGKIKGNVLNVTNPDKPALGYFRITQKHTLTHTIYEQEITDK